MLAALLCNVPYQRADEPFAPTGGWPMPRRRRERPEEIEEAETPVFGLEEIIESIPDSLNYPTVDQAKRRKQQEELAIVLLALM